MPPSLFAYLRPGHGKRNASSPASLSHEASAAESHGAEHRPRASLSTTDAAVHASTSTEPPVSPAPPQLPPIPRITSTEQSPERQESNTPAVQPPSRPSPNVTSPISEGVRPSSTSDPVLSASMSTPDLLGRALHVRSPSFLSPSDIASGGYSSASRSVTSQTSLLSHRNEKRASTPKMVNTPTQAPQKSGKARLMSIFHRRRSGEVIQNLSEDSLVSRRSPSLVPPIRDNDDPSIRGRIVHDFSAPRPNRQHSFNERTSDRESSPGRVSPQKIERQHTPLFRENFDDDTSYEQSQAAIRAEQLANSSFVARNSYHPPAPESSPSPPPMPQHSPPPAPQYVSVLPPDEPLEPGRTLLSPVLEAPSPMDGSPEGTPRMSKSFKSTPRRSRATSGAENTFVPGSSLAHHPSSSSRFSFQVGNGESAAQEKALEERHREQEAKRKSKEALMPKTSMEDDYYDGYDMDDYDMDDGGYDDIPMLGEDIPMVGEEPEFGTRSTTPGMSAFDFSTLSIPAGNTGFMSPVGMNSQLQTPIDANGNPIGTAISGDATQGALCDGDEAGAQQLEKEQTLSDLQAPFSQSTLNNELQFLDPNALGLLQSNTMPGHNGSAGLDDDLYFDDGIIGELGDGGESTFDENIFDDPTGPLFDRKVKMPSTEDPLSALHSHPSEEPRPEAEDEVGEKDPAPLPKEEVSSLGRMPSLANQHSGGQTINLEKFSSALTEALQKAEAEGRFARKLSVDTEHSATHDYSQLSDSRPSLIPDDSRVSQETTGFQPDDEMLGLGSGFYNDDFGYGGFETGLDDDPDMIAAANAEALAVDDEGFYGQEFGFYANAQGESWNAYGGYFGNPSSIGRTKSGRNAVIEPSLTPITERSEYSTRNSFVSVNHFRDSQLSLHSPGLAQLRMSPYGFPEDDADMSLEALKRLRGKAFGGSSASLGSPGAGSPRNSSPMGMHYMPRNASPMAHYPVFASSDPLVTSGEDELGGDKRLEELDDGALDAINAVPLDDDDDIDEDEDAAEAAAQDKGSRAESPTLMSSDFNALSAGVSGIDLTTPSSPPVSSPPAQTQTTNASITSPGPTMLPASDPHFGIIPAQPQPPLLALTTNMEPYPLPPPHPHDVLNYPASPGVSPLNANPLNPIDENAPMYSPCASMVSPMSPANANPSLLSLPHSPCAITSTSSIALAPLIPKPPPKPITVSSTTPSISKRQSLGLIPPSPTSPTTSGASLGTGLSTGLGGLSGFGTGSKNGGMGSGGMGNGGTGNGGMGNGGMGGSKSSMHSRRSSGLVSSYVKEEDERGEERWVLERRMTAESGEMELVGREVVEGGRI